MSRVSSVRFLLVMLSASAAAFLFQAGLATRVSANAAAKRSRVEPGKVIVNSIGMKLVEIPAGEFLMGSPAAEAPERKDERPQHMVKLTKPFLLGQYEVTQEQYEKVMEKNPSYFSKTGAGAAKVDKLDTSRFPVENLSWDEALKFCKQLSELPAEKEAGRTYRLPSEAEWQYACRAGTTTPFYFGSGLSAKNANFNGNFPFPEGGPRDKFLGRTTTVGSYDPNHFGLYDMHGNVAEYCADWYGRDYYEKEKEKSPSADPTGPEKGSDKLVTGGHWGSNGNMCRCAYRRSNATTGGASYFGLRVACDLSKP